MDLQLLLRDLKPMRGKSTNAKEKLKPAGLSMPLSLVSLARSHRLDCCIAHSQLSLMYRLLSQWNYKMPVTPIQISSNRNKQNQNPVNNSLLLSTILFFCFLVCCVMAYVSHKLLYQVNPVNLSNTLISYRPLFIQLHCVSGQHSGSIYFTKLSKDKFNTCHGTRLK